MLFAWFLKKIKSDCVNGVENLIKIRNLTTKMCEGEILMTRTLAKIRVQNFDVFYTSEFLFRPNIKMTMCYSLVKPTWYPLFSFTWNSIPGEARCWVFLRNLVTHREHLPLDIFGGWHLSIHPILWPTDTQDLTMLWFESFKWMPYVSYMTKKAQKVLRSE